MLFAPNLVQSTLEVLEFFYFSHLCLKLFSVHTDIFLLVLISNLNYLTSVLEQTH